MAEEVKMVDLVKGQSYKLPSTFNEHDGYPPIDSVKARYHTLKEKTIGRNTEGQINFVGLEFAKDSEDQVQAGILQIPSSILTNGIHQVFLTAGAGEGSAGTRNAIGTNPATGRQIASHSKGLAPAGSTYGGKRRKARKNRSRKGRRTTNKRR